MQNSRRLFQHLLRKYSTWFQPSPEKRQLRNQNTRILSMLSFGVQILAFQHRKKSFLGLTQNYLGAKKIFCINH